MSELNDTQSNAVVAPAKKRSSLWITILIFFIILAVGLFIGYQSGLGDRRQAASVILNQQLEEQFQLGVKALDSGLYQVALKNFQFVIQQDPNYPGAQDKLVEVLLKLSLSPTTSVEVTPMFTATPDLRGAEAIFTQARTSIAAQDWTGALENLDALRKADPTYKTVEVDGMYYITLILRGEGKIVNQDCKAISLEGGIYDLTLAERFGPLDDYAQSLRNWARIYITGASFWEIDWNQVLFYFDQLYINMPYLMDSSCITSMQRYRIASILYADSLVASGDVCGAKEYYDAALLISNQDNSLVVPTATYAWEQCEKQNQPQSTDAPQVSTETPTPDLTTSPTPSETPIYTPIP
jgi:tetratricopeptide (TPR) repeat protein